MANKAECIIVSGAPDNDLDFIKNNISEESFVIAADSGYKKLSAINIKPDLIVADFDSSEAPDFDVEISKSPIEKDSTDTFNAVKTAIERGYKSILILGALGGRFDHTYSNILCLDYAAKNGADCVIADSHNRISLIKDKKIIDKEYKWFSLFAYLEDCEGVVIKGAHYSAGFYKRDSLNFKLGDQIGQSNFVENDYCEISVNKGTLMLIESNDYK